MTPRARTAVDDQPEGVRERILDAATAILRETGIHGLSQLQVARRAEVRQSHVTYYFPKRHDLVEAVALRFVEHAFGALGEAVTAAAPGELLPVLQRMAAAVADEGHMRMFTGVIVEADGDPELREALVRVTRQLQETLAGCLSGDDRMERARLLLASLWGMGLYDFTVRPRRRSPLGASLLRGLLDPASARRTGST